MQAPNDTSAVRRAYDVLRKAYNEKPYLDAEAREDLLHRLEKMLLKYEDELVKAMSDDFGFRNPFEARTADVLIPLDAARYARKHVREWMQRRTVNSHPLSMPSHTYVEPIPLGVVGVIAPWNYPVLLTISPAAAAFAAGNRVLLKPSEVSAKTTEVLAKAIAEFFKPDEFAVVTGGAEVAREVTNLPLDHILFTGSTQVGRLVLKAAAENLVPATLELGGKSPALIHPSYNLDAAVERIALGKTFNGGQTCVGVDYVLVPRALLTTFVDKLKARLEFQHAGRDNFTTMITDRAFKRMEALLADAKSKGAKAIETFKPKEGTRAFPPTLLLDVNDEMTVMQEEIFGPLLPIIPYDTVDEAIANINGRPRPLSLYYFDDDAERIDDVLHRVPSGGVCVNDTLIHFAQEEVPLGGVGASGMGQYHGVAGFERLSHLRGVMVASRVSPAYLFLKPPYPGIALRTVNFLIRGLQGFARSLS